MTEETVTKSILKWLISNGWNIVCFDFPQSGTGVMLHSNSSISEKNKDGIIPDIVAVRSTNCLFLENKDRFYFPDYKKINSLKNDGEYYIAINNLLSSYPVENIYYGIGLPTIKHNKKSAESALLVDFIVGVNADFSISILVNNSNINIE